MRKVFGFGINDSTTPIQTKGWVDGVYKVNWRCPFYTKWANMLRRCYGPNSDYEDCIVSEEWVSFSNFREWMKTKDWQGKHLDKDLFGENKYSPETCVFISNEMNSFIKSSVNKFGLPRGVSKSSSGSIYAHISIDGKNHYLGAYSTVDEAKCAYISEKVNIALVVFKGQPPELIDALIRKLKNEY